MFVLVYERLRGFTESSVGFICYSASAMAYDQLALYLCV